MRTTLVMLAMLLAFGGCAQSHSAAGAKESHPLQRVERGTELQRDMTNLMNLSVAIHLYASEHGGQLPSSLGQTLPYIQPQTHWTEEARPKGTNKEKATLFISPRDMQGKSIPENPTADWIDANTSYVYLGRGGSELPQELDWGRTVIVHGKLDGGYDVIGRDKQIVRVVPVAMLDGHAEAEEVTSTQRLIAESSKRLKP